MNAKRKIAVVDDDNALRDSLGVLLRFRDFDVTEFASGEDFLQSQDRGSFDCIILDLKMAGIGGLGVLERCKAERVETPFIVVTAFADVASAKTALKSGAFDYLEKPVDEGDMLQVIEQALSQMDRKAAMLNERKTVEECMSRLSARESEILQYVVAGQHNREIAASLEISVRTVEVYKARMMEKMRVTRLADLIRLMTRHADETAAPV